MVLSQRWYNTLAILEHIALLAGHTLPSAVIEVFTQQTHLFTLTIPGIEPIPTPHTPSRLISRITVRVGRFRLRNALPILYLVALLARQTIASDHIVHLTKLVDLGANALVQVVAVGAGQAHQSGGLDAVRVAVLGEGAVPGGQQVTPVAAQAITHWVAASAQRVVLLALAIQQKGARVALLTLPIRECLAVWRSPCNSTCS